MATLEFSIKHKDGTPTNFIGKIWQGLINEGYESDMNEFLINANDFQLELFDFKNGEFVPKLHTIREDKNNFWKVGMKIHMVVFNRTKNRYQFAPVLEVKSVQKIEMINGGDGDSVYDWPLVIINGNAIKYKKVQKLALNDGFDSIEQFFKWFDKDFEGKIIHWTNLKY